MGSVNTEACKSGQACRDREGSTIPEVPPTIDPIRPPQRNDDNRPCQCGWGCMCGGLNHGCCAGPSCLAFPGHHSHDVQHSFPDGARTDHGSVAVIGEDGTEEHLLVDVEQYGLISLAAIFRALVRLNRHGMLPEYFEEYCSAISPCASEIWSPSSVTVEHDDSDRSMVSSQVLSMRAPSPSYFSFMGGPFEFEHDGAGVPGTLFNAYGPIWLAPEISRPTERENENSC